MVNEFPADLDKILFSPGDEAVYITTVNAIAAIHCLNATGRGSRRKFLENYLVGLVEPGRSAEEHGYDDGRLLDHLWRIDRTAGIRHERAMRSLNRKAAYIAELANLGASADQISAAIPSGDELPPEQKCQ